MKRTSDDRALVFMLFLGLTFGWVALIFGYYLWLYARVVFVMVALMLAWYFLGKSLSKKITRQDILREEADAQLTSKLAQIEEQARIFAANTQEEQGKARNVVASEMDDAILGLDKKIQELSATEDLFNMKLLQSRTAHEIFGLKDIEEKMAALRNMRDGVKDGN
jgi:hypothetical protein